MPFPRLTLRDAARPGAGLPTRADVAVFVGLVGRTAAAVPVALVDALTAAGWAGPGAFARSPDHVAALLDVPVAVDSWGAFEALYAWDQRVQEQGAPFTVPSRLGLAVRTFFAEGGAKAWIVRTGDPLPLIVPPRPRPDAQGNPLPITAQDDIDNAVAVARAKRLLVAWPRGAGPVDAAQRVMLIPGLGSEGDATAPATWHGVEHIWGIEDAAMLLLPDLPELLSPAPEPIADLPHPPPLPEDWKDCAPPTPGLVIDPRRTRPAVAAPRLDRDGYFAWKDQIRAVLDKLNAPRGSAHRRDVMLIASLPLPSLAPGATPDRTEAWPLALLDETHVVVPEKRDAQDKIIAAAVKQRLFDTDALGSARLQLAWPWVETTSSALLPEGVEGGEGVLAGVIARTALTMGAFRSAAGSAVPGVRRLWPELGSSDLERGLPGGEAGWMGDRLSLIGVQRNSFTLLSDATTSADSGWRAGGTSRLVGIILRAARWLGDSRLFDPAGPILWRGIRKDIEAFLEQLRQAGALTGNRPADAYEVRCDATTMTQADIDQGRTIVRVAVNPAQPIAWITVTLAMGGDAAALERAA